MHKSENKLPDDFAFMCKTSVLCWLASCNKNGCPSVSPKEIWELTPDNTILVADIASFHSVQNIRVQSAVCVSFVDVFRQRGYQAYGQASIIGKSEEGFLDLGARLLSIAEPMFQVRNLIQVNVDKVKPILAPSYGLTPPPSEELLIESALKTYGVKNSRV